MQLNIGDHGLQVDDTLLATTTDIEKLFAANSKNITLCKGIDLHIFDSTGITVINHTHETLISHEFRIYLNTNSGNNFYVPKEHYNGEILFFNHRIKKGINSSIGEIIAKQKFKINSETIWTKGISSYCKKNDNALIGVEINENNEIHIISVLRRC